MRKASRNSILNAAFVLAGLLIGSASLGLSPSGITYQGRILKPDGSPLAGANVQFKMQIRTPNANNCLMYEEIQALDMRNSNGVFSLTINDGSGSRTDATGLGLNRIFANRGSFTFDPTTCASGTDYIPSSGDGRALVVQFKDETMATWEPIPAQRINYVPFAFESNQVQGFTPTSLVRVQEVDGTMGNISPLSNANYTELLALINGTTAQYTKAGQLAGVAMPAMTSGQVLGWNGSAWVSTDPVPAAGSITSTQLAAGAVTTGAIANNVSISTSGTLTSAITTTRDFKIYAASPSTFSVEMLAPALASSYSLTWPLTAGSNGQVLTTDGAGNLSWGAGGVSSQWATNANNVDIGYTTGKVGIGTTAPSSTLTVVGGTSTQGLSSTGPIGYSGVNTTSTTGLFGVSSSPNFILPTATGTYDSFYSDLVFGVTANSTAQVNGGDFQVFDTSFGSLSSMSGVNTTVTHQGVGTLASAYGVNSTVTAFGAPITNAYGGAFSVVNNAGTIGTGYGVYIGGVAGTAKYSLYASDSTAPSYFAGKVGVGTASPSALLHLKAGATGAGTSPLKFTSGSKLTTPEDGAMEYDGSNFYLTIGATRTAIPLNGVASSGASTSSMTFNSNTDASGSDGGFNFQANGSNLMTISNAGDVSLSSTTNAWTTTGQSLNVAGGLGVVGNIIGGASINGAKVVAGGVNNTVYTSTSSADRMPGIAGTDNAVLQASNSNNLDGSGAYLRLMGLNTSNKAQGFYIGAVSNTGAAAYTPTVVFGQQTGATSYAERMRMDTNGNVGIGTTAPGRLLDVAGPMHLAAAALPATPVTGDIAVDSGAANALKWYNGTSWQTVGTGSGNGDFKSDGSVTMTGQVVGKAGAVGSPSYTFTGDLTSGLYQNGAGVTSIASAGVDYMDIGGGNGVTVNKLLQVNQGVYSTSSNATIYTASGGTDLTPTGSSKSSSMQVYNSQTSNNGTSASYLGRVINSTSVNQYSYMSTVSVAGAGYSPALTFGQSTGASTYTERLRIDSTGNVGIGSTAPSSKLEVRGAIRSVASTGSSPDNATSTVDFSLSNNQSMSTACTATTLNNLNDGATYNLLVTETSASTCVFTGTGLTFYYTPANGSRIGGKPTMYSFTRIGANVVVSWAVLN